jgi:hypothetical protein
VAFDPAVTTTVCDAYLAQVLVDVEDHIACADGLQSALASIRTETQEPFARLHLSRPDCALASCADVAASTADVTAWPVSGGRTWHVSLTYSADAIAVGIPVPGPAAAWPASDLSGGSIPALSRPSIDGAPREVTARTPLPYCGASERDANTAAIRCLIDAVLAAEPAELRVNTSGTEGGQITLLYRFLGHGAVVEYAGGEGAWHRTAGSLIPNPDGATFSFDPWAQGGVAVTDRPAATFDRDGWGTLRATLPAWWRLPVDAFAVDSDITSVTYQVADAPDVAMAYVTGAVASYGFTAEGRETDTGYRQARFTDGSTACSVNVVARGAVGGSRVEVLYPVGCPWP